MLAGRPSLRKLPPAAAEHLAPERLMCGPLLSTLGSCRGTRFKDHLRRSTSIWRVCRGPLGRSRRRLMLRLLLIFNYTRRYAVTLSWKTFLFSHCLKLRHLSCGISFLAPVMMFGFIILNWSRIRGLSVRLRNWIWGAGYFLWSFWLPKTSWQREKRNNNIWKNVIFNLNKRHSATRWAIEWTLSGPQMIVKKY